MTVKPWAKAIATIPGRPTPSPTTAPAPAPMNINAKVPMNSARSLGTIRLDIVLSRDEIDRWRDQVCAKQQNVSERSRQHGRVPPAGEASGSTPQRLSVV